MLKGMKTMYVAKMPGTTIVAQIEKDGADKMLTPMFYSGGLVLSQVTQITGLEGYIIQNWVKRKYLTPPESKKYSRCQLCHILNINVLKECFTFEQTEIILNYISNALKSEETGFSFDDNNLYSCFINALSKLLSDGGGITVLEAGNSKKRLELDIERIHRAVSTAVSEYAETLEESGIGTIPSALQKRLNDVLRIMVTSYEALEIKNKVVDLYSQLDFK